MDDDKPKEGTVQLAGEPLPTIPLPPDHVFRNAFLTAIKYRTVTTAIRAYNYALLERAATEQALVTLNEAHLAALRTVQKLRDAQTIHETDRLNRQSALLEAQVRHRTAQAQLTQTEHQEKLHELGREAELAHHQQHHSNVNNPLSREEQEMVDYFLAKIKPKKHRAILEQALADQQLTGQDAIDARELLNKIIQDST